MQTFSRTHNAKESIRSQVNVALFAENKLVLRWGPIFIFVKLRDFVIRRLIKLKLFVSSANENPSNYRFRGRILEKRTGTIDAFTNRKLMSTLLSA